MPAPRSSPAGGVLIAAGALIGTTVGFLINEVTASFLIGTTIGGALALLFWWRAR